MAASSISPPMAGLEPGEDPALGLFRVLPDDVEADPASDPAASGQLLQCMFREMKRLRLLDERMTAMQREGRVGYYGTSAGQEAVPIATALALEARDWVFPALRESAIMLARGFPLSKYLAQVYGNSLDVLKGRQMPSHMSAREVNQVSWSSCVGSQLPQAVGAAWGAKLKRDDVVTVGFMGDGATSAPDFHAALNFAGVFKVPCLLICQNNQFAISVPASRQTAAQTIAIKGRAYGVPSLRVDGNDVLAVYEAVKRAADLARSGGGPTFLECVTYRLGPDSTSDDPTRYRPQAEIDDWKRRDPLLRLRRHLVSRELLDEASEEALEQEILAEIAAAIAEVEPLSPPERASMFDDVYAEPPWHLREQREALLASPAPPKLG